MSAAVPADRSPGIGIVPLQAGRSFGAEVTNVDLRHLDDAGFAVHPPGVDRSSGAACFAIKAFPMRT